MAVKYVLIFILNSANPTEPYTARAWEKLFPSYDDCLAQVSTVEVHNAILKDGKMVEVPGEGPPKDEVLIAPTEKVLEEPDMSKNPKR